MISLLAPTAFSNNLDFEGNTGPLSRPESLKMRSHSVRECHPAHCKLLRFLEWFDPCFSSSVWGLPTCLWSHPSRVLSRLKLLHCESAQHIMVEDWEAIIEINDSFSCDLKYQKGKMKKDKEARNTCDFYGQRLQKSPVVERAQQRLKSWSGETVMWMHS